MARTEINEIKPLLKEYVESSSTLPELHWDKLGSTQLLFDPYSPNQKEKSAHFFLLIAAIDRMELVGTSENATAIATAAHGAMGKALFMPGKTQVLEEIVRGFDTYYRLGIEKDKIPAAIDAVNTFVQKKASGSLVDFAAKYTKPEELVSQLSGCFKELTGEQKIEHAWMYLRWMVRPFPDLNIFSNISPKQLQIPLTSFVRKIAYCLELVQNQEVDWTDSARNARDRKAVTEFAADLFPDDPTKVDYPFYIMGRWIRDEKLSIKLLANHLSFWKKLYQQLRKPPITFEIVSRNESNFEQSVRLELEKLQFMFLFVPYPLPLPEKKGAPHYRPDFVLPRCRKKGRIVILEPHGIWTPREKRVITLGKSTFSVWVNATQIDDSERMFVEKMRTFRELYKEMYYLILIVPSAVKERIEWEYPNIYDELVDGADIPKLLFDLKKNME